MPGQSAPPTFRVGPWWTAALILGLTLACYWPALNGEQVWDDDAHVTRPELRSVPGLWRIWSDVRATQQYYPLLHSAFWVEHRLWGDSTLGYHLVNLLLHAACACLLVLLLRRLKVPGAALAGLVFAVHPVCVESVAWISEQKNTLSLVFYLLAALAYLRFDEGRGTPKAARSYAVASFLFVLALLTKTVTATLPAALLVVLWWQRGRVARRDVLPLVPWFALAALSGLFTAAVEHDLVGARGSQFDLTLLERCLLPGRVIWFYLGKLLWPFDLGFVNVFPFIFSYVADHFQYLASIGIITACSAGAAMLAARAGPSVRSAGRALAALLVAALAVLSAAQSRTYSDRYTLYETTIERNPRCWMAHNNLGLWYEERGDLKAAIAQYEEALRLKEDYASVHNNLGGILRTMPGRSDEAFEHIREAVRLEPGFAEAHNNLGVWYGDRGDRENAAAEYGEALRLKPSYATAHNNLGSVLATMPGRMDEAVAHFQ